MEHWHYWLVCEKHVLVTYTRCWCWPQGEPSVRVPCRCRIMPGSHLPPGGFP